MTLCFTQGGAAIEHGSRWRHQNPKRNRVIVVSFYDAEKDALYCHAEEGGRVCWVRRRNFNGTGGYFGPLKTKNEERQT